MACVQTSTGIAMLGCCQQGGPTVRTSLALNWYQTRFDEPSGPEAVAAMAAFLNGVDFSTDPIVVPAVPGVFPGITLNDGQGFAVWYDYAQSNAFGIGFYGHNGNIGLAAYDMIDRTANSGKRFSVAQKSRVRFSPAVKRLDTMRGFYRHGSLFEPADFGGAYETASQTVLESSVDQGLISQIIINCPPLPDVVYGPLPFQESAWRGVFLKP